MLGVHTVPYQVSDRLMAVEAGDVERRGSVPDLRVHLRPARQQQDLRHVGVALLMISKGANSTRQVMKNDQSIRSLSS